MRVLLKSKGLYRRRIKLSIALKPAGVEKKAVRGAESFDGFVGFHTDSSKRSMGVVRFCGH